MYKTKVFEVPDNLVNAVEAYQYEVNARLNVISYMLSNNMNLNTDSFRTYQDQLVEFEEKYELAKLEVEHAVVTSFLNENGIRNANWNLDFTEKRLTIVWDESSENKSGCCQNDCCVNGA